MTDPIADMLTRVRNALKVKQPEVVIPWSKLKYNLAQILIRENYIVSAEKVEDTNKPILKLKLKYVPEGAAIRSLVRISKPGRRVYKSHKELPYVLNNLGIAIMSTSQGLMTNKEARRKQLGGEIICEIY